ncbi:MAG: carboxynorspermidine decarboxylase [Firmicutes bacterium]|nr:carboxynorspermidine decarboxylase [Bacillota bacterium]
MRAEDLPSPSYIIKEKDLKGNLEILQNVKIKSGAKIILAQKAFSIFSVYPLIAQYLDGSAASGIFEARLGFEEMGKETHVFSGAYNDEEIEQLLDLANYIVFNSFNQLNRYRDKVLAKGIKIGLRINPQCSTQEGPAIYDPCAPFSRLGITKENFDENNLQGVSGLHFHTLCQQNADALATTLKAVEEQFGHILPKMEWLNLGGGHHITRDDYDRELLIQLILQLRQKYNLQIYLEPGEAIALNAGILRCQVLDTIKNGMDIAILNTSAACHMPDVLEMPYRPPLKNSGFPNEKEFLYRLGGPTCLAGDIIGDYSFDEPLKIGDTLEFEDMAIYTMVKNNTFNGMPLPAIILEKENGQYEIIKEFDYFDFKNRLS